MIFIAGIEPKTVKLDKKPMLCPICGLAGAYYKRVDHYLSLFLIPVIRIKKGEPFLMCDRCEIKLDEFKSDMSSYLNRATNQCPYCDRELQNDYRFCPYCGRHRPG